MKKKKNDCNFVPKECNFLKRCVQSKVAMNFLRDVKFRPRKVEDFFELHLSLLMPNSFALFSFFFYVADEIAHHKRNYTFVQIQDCLHPDPRLDNYTANRIIEKSQRKLSLKLQLCSFIVCNRGDGGYAGFTRPFWLYQSDFPFWDITSSLPVIRDVFMVFYMSKVLFFISSFLFIYLEL